MNTFYFLFLWFTNNLANFETPGENFTNFFAHYRGSVSNRDFLVHIAFTTIELFVKELNETFLR